MISLSSRPDRMSFKKLRHVLDQVRDRRDVGDGDDVEDRLAGMIVELGERAQRGSEHAGQHAVLREINRRDGGVDAGVLGGRRGRDGLAGSGRRSRPGASGPAGVGCVRASGPAPHPATSESAVRDAIAVSLKLRLMAIPSSVEPCRIAAQVPEVRPSHFMRLRLPHVGHLGTSVPRYPFVRRGHPSTGDRAIGARRARRL